MDSFWVCEATSPTEPDNVGNVNNVYTSPPKPVEVVRAPDATAVTNGAVSEKTEPAAPAVADPSEAKVSDAAPSEGTTVTGEDQTPAPEDATFSQFASDLVDTIVARDGTSSALGYVASAVGAAIQSQIGVDPINSAKVSFLPRLSRIFCVLS